MGKIHLLDTKRSNLTSKEIQRYRQEITKQENSPVCKDMSTKELIGIGVKDMEADNFRLVKGQLDV